MKNKNQFFNTMQYTSPLKKMQINGAISKQISFLIWKNYKELLEIILFLIGYFYKSDGLIL